MRRLRLWLLRKLAGKDYDLIARSGQTTWFFTPGTYTEGGKLDALHVVWPADAVWDGETT